MNPRVRAFCRGNESSANAVYPLSQPRDPRHGTSGTSREPETAPWTTDIRPDIGRALADQRSDSELLTASATEPGVFTELYRRHAEDLLRYCPAHARSGDGGRADRRDVRTGIRIEDDLPRHGGERRWHGYAGREAPARPVLPGGPGGSRRAPTPRDARARSPACRLRADRGPVDFAPIRGAIAEALESLRDDHRDALSTA